MLKIKRENLLVVAGAVWLIAGINVCALGLEALALFNGLALAGLLIAATAIFGSFGAMFHKMMAKHVSRIRNYSKDRLSVFLFFDAKGYIIMTFMMTMGFGLRTLHLVPDWFVAFFYTGLGLALCIAGVTFLMARFCSREQIASFHRRHKAA